jgi:hypothetical protein
MDFGTGILMNRPNSIFIANALAFFVSILMAPQFLVAQDSSGTSSRRAKEAALQSIPMQQLNQATQQKLRPILNRPSIYRKLPVTSIEVDPDYYLHLIRHPEVIINIWQLMGVTQMTADRTGPYKLDTDDGVGTLGKVELVYGTNDMHIFYCEGDYNGSMLARNLRGKCVLVLKTNYQLNEEGETSATSQLDIFLKIDNATLGLIAKTLHPIIGSTADHNFTESINFLERLNETTVNNGPGVQGMAHRLDGLTPEVRREFVQVAGLVYDRARAKVKNASFAPAQGASASQPASLTRALPTQAGMQNPYINQSRTNFSDQPRQASVLQTIGDTPNSGQTNSRPVYSASQRSYSSNPYFGNRK